MPFASNKDLEERKHQVSHMSRIYGQAEMVIACLGEDVDRTLASLSDLEELIAMARSKWYPSNYGLDVIRNLTCRNYWRRAWVVQELILASRVSLWVGDTGVLAFRTFFEWMAGPPHLTKQLGAGNTSMHILYMFRLG